MKILIPITLLLILFLSGCSSQSEDILKLNLREHKNLALHIHPFLEIEVNGIKQVIPANVGISGQGMRVIHTHDDTGKLHIESPYAHQFYLKDFFTIWGKTLSSTCIFGNCADANHTLQFFVNGAKSMDKENIPLKDGDRIKVVYKGK